MDLPVITSDRIVQIGYAFREAKALMSAVELGVFTALADGPLDLETLRNKTGIHRRGARDFFDVLVALGLLDRDHRGRYVNAAEADLYLDRRKPTYIGADFEHLNSHLYARWMALTAAPRSGMPQTGAKSSSPHPPPPEDVRAGNQ